MNPTLPPHHATNGGRDLAMSPQTIQSPLPPIPLIGAQPVGPQTDTDQVMGNVQDPAGQHPPTQMSGEVSTPPQATCSLKSQAR